MITKAGNASHCVARLEAVRVTYDAYTSFALMDVNLEVRRGEILGLIGSKGSGKSTTLKLLAGRLRPNYGKVKVFGRSPHRAAIKRRLGYLPAVNSPSKPVGIRALLQRWFALRVQSAANLPTHIRLAHLLVKRPDLLLLDEPFVNFEAAMRSEMIDIMCKFTGEGKTVVLAHETLAVAMNVCHRLAIYCQGQIQAVGTLPELLAMPDAIRILGPVLPAEIAQRVLHSIRTELSGAWSENKALVQGGDYAPEPVDLVRKTRDGQSPKETADDELLKRLTKPDR